MADDLKTTLGKVLQSRGRKTFAFAYVTGRRSDGKGEGHLQIVPGRKTFKKDDLAEEVDKIGLFLFGKCWADTDGKIIFFQGKGLNNVLVVKMKLTAGKVTGRTFDLQLPDPDEEKRQAILEAADQEAEKYQKPPEAASQGRPVAERSASPPPAPPPPPPAGSAPARPAAAAPGEIARLAPVYQALSAKIDEGFRKLRDAAAAADAATPPNHAQADHIRQVIAEIQDRVVALKAHPTAADYMESIASLEVAARAMEVEAPRTAATTNLGGAESAESAALAGDYRALLTQVTGAVAKLRETNPTAAAEIQKLVGMAEGHAAAPNYAEAIEFLKEADQALKAAPAAEAVAPSKPGAAKAAALATLRQALAAARQQAIADLGQLGAKVLRVNDPDAPSIAGQIKSLADAMPAYLDTVLVGLEKAIQGGQADRIKQLQHGVQAAAKVWADFLKAEGAVLGACEKNPLRIPVRIVQPVQRSLQAILRATA